MPSNRWSMRAALWGSAALLLLAACSSSKNPGPASSQNPSGSPSQTGRASPTVIPAVIGDWPQYHQNALRSGVSPDQGVLGRVRTAWKMKLDGAVYAQPLVASGKVIVATERNSVYALDPGTGRALWHVSLGTPVNGGSLPCGNIDPSGITGTPVVDVASSAVYAVAFLARGPHHELFALDLASGRTRWHRTIDPPGLSASVEQERGALALSSGRVYVPFGGLQGDCGNYKGAIVSSAVTGSGALDSYVVPTQRMGGIWTPGGPVADESGDVWTSTGNSQSGGSFDYGNAILRLNAGLTVRDYFAPANWAALNAGDVDLGSVDPVLFSSSRVVAAGKQGVAYLLRRDALGHVGGAIASRSICSRAFGTAAFNASMVFMPCENALVGLGVRSGSLGIAWRDGNAAGPAIIAARVVWAIGYDGVLRAYSPSSGRVLFSSDLGAHVSRFVSPSAASGRLFAPAGSGLVAFSLR